MIDLTPAELQTLAGLLDAGVRHVGLRALTEEALSIVRKINAAAKEPAVAEGRAAGAEATA